MFGGESAEQQQAADGKTFEPGEDLADLEAAAMDEDEEAAAAQQQQQAAEEQQEQAPKASAAPTVEQITAVKAAIANAQTLQEMQMLEQALAEGRMPSQFQFKQAQQQNGESVAMDEG